MYTYVYNLKSSETNLKMIYSECQRKRMFFLQKYFQGIFRPQNCMIAQFVN